MQNKPDSPPASRSLLSRRFALGALGAFGASAALSSCSGSGASGDAAARLPLPSDASDAALKALAISGATLSPVFAAATTSYVVNVSTFVSTVTVTPTVNSSMAVVQVQGVVVNSGTPSGAIAVAIGTTSIAVLVTAADGTTRTYTIVVNRAPATCTLIPAETEGPYPLPSILTNAAMVRRNITEGKPGVPMRIVLSLVNVNQSCAPIVGARVYVWMCDKDGTYSGYTNPQNGAHVGETYLRGVQVTDAIGQVTFDAIYPGWYAGRITHVHFQIFLPTNTGTVASRTSQFAFPQAVTQTVYASTLYAARGQNTSVAGFAADNVFSDGVTFQLATLTGSVAAGYTAALTVSVAG